MGAFSIAFDTIIVGALALPGVLLVIHLFFSDTESRLKTILDWVKQQEQPALAGVLLFAMAYSLGSAVSRIAQDFFDDDDLHLRLLQHVYRVGVTETSIRADVYCQKRWLVAKSLFDSFAGDEHETFWRREAPCQYTGSWIIPLAHYRINRGEGMVGEVFHIQEAEVLLKGSDATERVRQFHDQIMVLRGAAFDGLIAFSLCLFWWCSTLRSPLRWSVLAVYLLPAAIASYNHYFNHPSSPPYMEFTLLVLVAAGCYVLWQHEPKIKDEASKQSAPGQSARSQSSPNQQGDFRPAYLVLSLFLTAASFLGWWDTQVLYDEQVIYSSYRTMGEVPAKPGTADATSPSEGSSATPTPSPK
jgi:hypothetical protein